MTTEAVRSAVQKAFRELIIGPIEASEVLSSNPADTYLFGENGDGDWVVEPATGSSCGNYAAPGGAWFWHHGGANWVYADGHTKWIKKENTDANNCFSWKLN